jgi:hypothetical protein
VPPASVSSSAGVSTKRPSGCRALLRSLRSPSGWRAGGIERRQQARHAGGVASLATEGRVAREAVARRGAAVVHQRGDERRRAAVGRRARQLAKARRAAQDAVDAHAGRESRGADLGVAGQPAADQQFLHAVRARPELPVVAVTVAAIVRVDADDDQAVVDVAADAQAGERAGAEMVGGVAAAADHGVAAEVGADAHGHRLEAAADLQELQRAGGELTGGVAADDELRQRTADVGAPVGTRALAADTVGATVDSPQAGDGAADLCRAEDETTHPAARQAQVAEGVTADVEIGEAVALETGAGGDVAEVQAVHGAKARGAGEAGERCDETAERAVGVEAGQRDAAVAAAAGEFDTRTGVGTAEIQVVAGAVRGEAGKPGAGNCQGEAGAIGIAEVE